MGVATLKTALICKFFFFKKATHLNAQDYAHLIYIYIYVYMAKNKFFHNTRTHSFEILDWC